MLRRQIMNPLKQQTKEIDCYFLTWKQLNPKPYDKKKASPYTKTRVILMNGTEYESVWFMHNFARHCKDKDIKEALAVIRAQEQQQQKRISCLKPIDETILETTIGYEQLAIDLTATLAKHETNPNNKMALDFALLEDFDHLYRYSNLLKQDENIDAKILVGEQTEITPGRPTVNEHRYPIDNLRPHMNAKTAETFSKLVGCIITAAEQQTMNYYMNVAGFYKNEEGRKLYAEIAMVEEEHVTQYESLKDPNLSWLEQWVMHEYAECYLYYSMMKDEVDNAIKKIWEEHYEMECAHLKTACYFLDKYEHKTAESVIGVIDFPELLTLGQNIEYVQQVLANTAYDTFAHGDYVDSRKLDSDSNLCKYNKLLGRDPKTDPSHMVITASIKEFGQDYRFETQANPVDELQDRTTDNTTVGFPNCK